MKPPVIRHRRNVGDVAMCGERGGTLAFAQTGRFVTCEACNVLRKDPVAVARWKARNAAEAAAKRKLYRIATADNRTEG